MFNGVNIIIYCVIFMSIFRDIIRGGILRFGQDALTRFKHAKPDNLRLCCCDTTTTTTTTTTPGHKINDLTVCVQPERCNYLMFELEQSYGICSDNILYYIRYLNQY